LPEPGPVYEITLGGALSEIARAARWVATLVPPARLQDVQLCLEEALANIVTHGLEGIAAPRIRVSLSNRSGRLLLEIEDNGAPFDPVSFVAPPRPRSLEEARPGGAGIALMRKFSDGILYARKGALNCLSLSFEPAGVKPGGSSKPGR
jgi:serine/threonine-protein kinase RsbW